MAENLVLTSPCFRSAPLLLNTLPVRVPSKIEVSYLTECWSLHGTEHINNYQQIETCFLSGFLAPHEERHLSSFGLLWVDVARLHGNRPVFPIHRNLLVEIDDFRIES